MYQRDPAPTAGSVGPKHLARAPVRGTRAKPSLTWAATAQARSMEWPESSSSMEWSSSLAP